MFAIGCWNVFAIGCAKDCCCCCGWLKLVNDVCGLLKSILFEADAVVRLKAGWLLKTGVGVF